MISTLLGWLITAIIIGIICGVAIFLVIEIFEWAYRN